MQRCKVDFQLKVLQKSKSILWFLFRINIYVRIYKIHDDEDDAYAHDDNTNNVLYRMRGGSMGLKQNQP